MPSKYSVGQTLWLVPYERRHEPRSVTITKVGSRWLHIDSLPPGRVDSKTLHVDNGGYGGTDRCWPSREHYEELQRAMAASRSLRESLSSADSVIWRSEHPARLRDAIEQARALLERFGLLPKQVKDPSNE